MKNKILILILTLTLFLTMTPFNSSDAYGAEYVKGQSIIAEDQEKASIGLDFPGLDITWLDLGDSHIQSYSQMDTFSEGIFDLNLSDGAICFDTNGKIIAVGDYNGIFEFSDGMAKVYKYIPREEPDTPGRLIGPPGQMEGFIDKEGNEVIPLGMHSNMGDNFHEGFTTIGAYEENKGFINKKGEIVIPQIYKDAGNFSEGLAAVQSVETELWGYIDKEGELVIPMIYEAAKPFREEAAYVVKDGLAGYIDKEGNNIIDFKLIPETDKYVDNSFYDGLAVTQDSSGKYGYINKKGDFVIPAKYKEASPFIGEAAFVLIENHNYPNGYGSSFLINRDDERLTPLWQYGIYAGEYMREDLIRAISTYGPSPRESLIMLNKYGAEVIPSSLDIQYLSSFNEGYALMIAHNDGKTAAGLVKIPENIESYKERKLIRVFIDDKLLELEDTDPIIENSRTLVPMRAIFETLGAEVDWDGTNKTAVATKDGTTISLKIDDNIAYINDEPVELDVPARIKNSRTLVPVRFVAESLNADVTWDDASRAVIIDTASDIAEKEKNQIQNLVKSFGENLKMVSLMAPEDIVKDSLEENYGELVSPALLEKWQNDPVNAPGRVSSSPWPERIDIESVDKLSDSEYEVNGNIIEMTSVEMTSVEMTQGGIAASKPVTLNIKKIEDKWLIDDVTKGEYIDINSSVYNNKEYGFYFTLPESWKGFSIVEDKWEGVSLVDSKENQSGALIYIRHPEWTEETTRQDIPVMIFTMEQWETLNNEEFSVGAAPVLPGKLGENSKYVFALPARYNYSFLTGFEEVEEIIEGKPLQTFEIE